MIARRVGRVFSALLLAAGLLFGLLLVAPALMGYQRYVIVSGSMTGTYDRGSLVFDKVVPVSGLKTGDVITYRPPYGGGPTGLVTHRIVTVTADPRATHGRYFETKGDANKVKDPWTFTLSAPRQARVVAGVPYVGFVLAALSRRDVRMALVGFPAALIALASLAGLWRQTGEEVDVQAPSAVTVSAS
jgi:signal peptidase